MKKLLFTLLGLGLAIGGTVFAATFNSAQVGSSPQNGYYLQTNGTVSTWAAVSATGGSGTISTSTDGRGVGEKFLFGSLRPKAVPKRPQKHQSSMRTAARWHPLYSVWMKAHRRAPLIGVWGVPEEP